MGCAVAALLAVPGSGAVRARPDASAASPPGAGLLAAPGADAGAGDAADLLERSVEAVRAAGGTSEAIAGDAGEGVAGEGVAALPLLPSDDDLSGMGPASVTRLPATGEVVMAATQALQDEADGDAAPRARRVFVAGDSLTSTSLDPARPGPGAPEDLVVASGLGWTAVDVQPHLDAALAEGPIDTLVVALGTNDSAPPPDRDGWTEADVEAFRRLIGSVPDAACVVVVLPGHGATADPAHDEPMDRARMTLWSLAEDRRQGDWYGPTIVLDWQERIDARPDLLSGDGIHLAPIPGVSWARPETAQVRKALYWEGVAACEASAP